MPSPVCGQNPVFMALSVVISQALLLGLVYFMMMAPSPSLPLQFPLFLDNPLFPGFFVVVLFPSASRISPGWVLPLSWFWSCVALDVRHLGLLLSACLQGFL